MLALGQYQQERLFPELSGEILLDEVVDQYKATILFFDYGTTRDTMFREVYAVNDSLECVYSGHTLYMDPNRDPTTTVFMNGADNGINTEHTYPRSKGAAFGNAKSDMHHLYPARAMVNEERSNFPFGDIEDDKATKWFWKDQTLLTKPHENLDEYSEWKWQVFEPRESHKGNVARAVMYFYTMYKAQADAEDPDFFWDMLPDLCNWHFEDPVDSAEYTRTWLIAQWQQHPNPFVLDCSLATRTYCTEMISDDCELAVPIVETKTNDVKMTYSLFSESIEITEVPEGQNRLIVYGIDGKLIDYRLFSTNHFSLNVGGLMAGIYVATLVTSQGENQIKFTRF